MTALSHVEGPALDPDSVAPLTATIADWAKTRPDTIALVLDGRRMSYGALEQRTQAAARLLVKHGIGAGDRFGWCGINDPDFFPAMLAAMRIGAVLVTINWRLKEREVAYILEDSGARLVIADAAFRETVDAAAASGSTIIATAEFSALLDGDGDGTWPQSRWDEPALLLYTSGTTGSPKGVQISERGLTLAKQQEVLCGGFDDWDDREVLLSPLPLFHIGGIGWASCGLTRGCTVVLTNNAAPPALLDLCLAEGVTRTFMVPQLVRGLLEQMVERDVRVPSLKGIYYGAAPMDAPLLQRCIADIGCKFLQYFGMTEMTGTISILPPADHDPARPHLLRSVGKALPGAAIEIRNPEGAVVPVGEAGEIWTRGPTMMLGYANRPEQTAEAIVDGWYRTGDGGRIDEGGFLYLTDRIKDMIVTGGENVYPVEVEAVLREHPDVVDCAVFALPDDVWGERVCAAVELRPDAAFDAEAMIAFVKHEIAGYKAPRQVIAVDALPRTASGKVQRGKLRAAMAEPADA